MYIVIDGYEIQVDPPYKAGQTIGELEARLLNQAYYSNVRARVSGVNKTRAKSGLPNMNREELIAFVNSYKPFQRAGKANRVVEVDPVEVEARSLAKQAVLDYLKSKGRKLSEMGPNRKSRQEWLDRAVSALLERDPSYRSIAADVVRRRSQTNVAAVSDLIAA